MIVRKIRWVKNGCVKRTRKNAYETMIIDDPNNNCNGIETNVHQVIPVPTKSTDLPRRVQVIIVTQK